MASSSWARKSACLREISNFCGAKEVISCANGTDALALVLMAKNLKPGDAVLCPSFTFAATAEVVAWFGATPIFVDVLAETFNMSPRSLEQGIARSKSLGLNPVAVIPVDLFGQPADYDLIETDLQGSCVVDTVGRGAVVRRLL